VGLAAGKFLLLPFRVQENDLAIDRDNALHREGKREAQPSLVPII
jgi:hypothetical protein